MNCASLRNGSARIFSATFALVAATLVSACGGNQVTLTPAPARPLYHGAPWKSVALGYSSGEIVSAVKGAGNDIWFADSSQDGQTVPFLGTITSAGATRLYQQPYFSFEPDTVAIDLQPGPGDTTYFMDNVVGYGIENANGTQRFYQTDCFFDCTQGRTGLRAPGSEEMAVTADGDAWFGGYDSPPLPFTAYLVRARGSIDTALPLPDALRGRVPNDFTIGPDGNVWFTSTDTAVIGKADPADNRITTVVVPASVNPDRGYSKDLVTGPDGNVWVFLCGKTESKLLRITTAGTMTAFPLPASLATSCVSTSHGLIAGADQAIWSVAGSTSVMKFSTATGQVGTYGIYPTPKTGYYVATLARGQNDDIWAFAASSAYVYALTPNYAISTQPSSLNLKVNQRATVTVAESRYDGAFDAGSEACASVTRFGASDSFAVDAKAPGSCFVHFADTLGFATAYVHVVVSN